MTMQTLHEADSTLAIEKRVTTLAERVAALTIVDQESYNYVALILRDEIKPIETEIEKELGAAKDITYRAWKDACDRYNRFMAPVAQAKKLANRLIGEWDEAQEHARQEAQRAADEEARKREEEERLAAAIAAEEAGANKREVKAILESPAPLQTVKLAPTYEKMQGVRTPPAIWSCRVDDKLSLVKFVAKNPRWLHLLEPVMPQLNGLARTQKELFAVPGCTAIKQR